MLLTVAALQGRQACGPRVLAAGCEYALRAIHRLSDDFVPTVAFNNPANAARFRERVR